MPTTTQLNQDPQNSLLSVVRESQAAVVDMLRAWTDISQQLTRNLGLPMARIDVAGADVAGAVDRAFDIADQILAAQRQLTFQYLDGPKGGQEESGISAGEEADCDCNCQERG